MLSVYLKLFPLLGDVTAMTFAYPQGYFDDLEEITQLVLASRSKIIEISAFGRQLYVPPLDRAGLDKLKTQLAPLLYFDRLRFAFLNEFEKGSRELYAMGKQSRGNFFE